MNPGFWIWITLGFIAFYYIVRYVSLAKRTEIILESPSVTKHYASIHGSRIKEEEEWRY
ncbi:hypothetical protein LCY76_01395 [Fictibacillus sp. KIGAM418]|uniref:Uncharacterized protein n=1 Tax=Fictibacillus marinisediminis TaxID=2878389 RepID=A0A9X1X8T9_9BACL|nr:hypothetical protein [Fictibacillus marinisediminis]MCK6255300.1 hypothetical protein [Fictibacillus marinisediminis]